MQRVTDTVFAKPAKDHFELNVNELRCLSKLFGGSEPTQLVEDYFSIKLNPSNVDGFITRVCGSKEIGLLMGIFDESELKEAATKAQLSVKGSSYKVVCRPFRKDLVALFANGIGGKVCVGNPQLIVNVSRLNGKYLVGVSPAVTTRVRLTQRPPKKWAYFHAGVLPPHFSALMCNLTACPEMGVLIDPFCGAGSTLVAASVLRIRVLGVELGKKQVYGCRRNMAFLGLTHNVMGIIRADASRLPTKKAVFDSAVFDPPYGRVSSLFGQEFEELLSNVLRGLWLSLKPNGKICFLCPLTEEAVNVVEDKGFEVVYTHKIPVHRSLTRLLIVADKVAK
jgi:putative methyltransferase (TIGR01177 family)